MNPEVKTRKDTCYNCNEVIEFPEMEGAKITCNYCGKLLVVKYYECQDEDTKEDCSFFFLGKRQNNMTKQEAIQAMHEGKAVVHRFFLPSEFIKFSPDGRIETEDGYLINPVIFWAHRREPGWEIDWELYNLEQKIEEALKR